MPLSRWLFILLATTNAGLAAATTIDVTSTSGGSNDGSGCTLRDAIEAVNLRAAVGQCPAASGPVDTIDIEVGQIVFGQHDPNSAGAVLPALVSGRLLNVFGLPQARTTLFVDSYCVGYLYRGRLLEVKSGAGIFIADVDFDDGCADAADALGGVGGAIANYGNVYLTRSRLYLNSTADDSSGSVLDHPGAAVYNGPDAQFTAIYVTFDSNSGDGAVYVDTDTDTGFASISDSTFVDNTGSAIDNYGGTAVTNATFFGNSGKLSGAGAGAGPQGGAIFDESGAVLNVSFATLLDNHAARLDESEVEVAASAAAFIKSTLFGTPANGISGNCRIEAGASAYWFGVSISNDPTCAGGANLVDTDPLVDSAPADNGGPTRTLKLQAGSPAFGIDADCLDVDANPVTTDQRGDARPRAHCDAGAYEGDLVFANGFDG